MDTLTDRFWKQVEKQADGCWLWRGRILNGYGWWSQAVAHRCAYVSSGRIIPDGYHLDHLCRVRNCVNPDHLEPVTPRENARRGLTGAHNRNKTHCKQGHAYTPENTAIGKSGWRACITCRRERRSTGTRRPRAAGCCIWGHQMTPENTYVYPSGRVVCRECYRSQRRKRYQTLGNSYRIL